MANTAQLKAEYKEKIAPALQKQFNYTSAMQIPALKKIVVNQGLGDATQEDHRRSYQRDFCHLRSEGSCYLFKEGYR